MAQQRPPRSPRHLDELGPSLERLGHDPGSLERKAQVGRAGVVGGREKWYARRDTSQRRKTEVPKAFFSLHRQSLHHLGRSPGRPHIQALVGGRNHHRTV